MRFFTPLLLAASALFAAITTASADPVKLCTGSPTGVYFAAGKDIATMAGRTVDIALVTTEGTIDNMRRTLDLAKSDPESCDAFIGQPDGPAYRAATNKASVSALRAVTPLHREYLHGLCNKASKVTDIGDLENDPTKYSIAIGPAGNGTVGEADQSFGDTIALVGANDRDFDDATDVSGKPLYEYANIPGATYPTSFDYWSDVKTISWPATLYINKDKLSVADQKAFATAAARAAPGIRARYGK